MLTLTKFTLVCAVAIGLQGALSCRTMAQEGFSDPYTIGVVLHSREGCPMVIWHVIAKSPADAAGIAQGDRVLAIGGTDVSSRGVPEVSRLIRSDYPGTVTLRLSRSGNDYSVVVTREKLSSIVTRDGSKKIKGGIVVPADTTEAEIKRMTEFDGRRITAQVFPLHYPSDPDSYYGGFELFVLQDPDEVVVGGLEDGPASRSGIHWGDRILSANGADPTGRAVPELERMFSSRRPDSIQLKVERAGHIRTVQFKLEQTADILKQNGKQLTNGQVVPIGLSSDDVRCFTEKK